MTAVSSIRFTEVRSPVKMYKVILTRELGRLCKWLRILGFDAEYYKEDNLASLIIRALRDKRTVITRRKEIGDLKIVIISSDHVKEQIQEVLTVFDYRLEKAKMFSRCVVCNQELVPADKEKVRDKVPEYVFQTQDRFFCCEKCGRVYWQGTHWGNVQDFLKNIK